MWNYISGPNDEFFTRNPHWKLHANSKTLSAMIIIFMQGLRRMCNLTFMGEYFSKTANSD